MEPIESNIVTWRFYIDHPEGEHRLRQCMDAPNVLRAVEDFERWLRDIGEVHDKYSVEDIREMLFDCFNDNDVRVPGFE